MPLHSEYHIIEVTLVSQGRASYEDASETHVLCGLGDQCSLFLVEVVRIYESSQTCGFLLARREARLSGACQG